MRMVHLFFPLASVLAFGQVVADIPAARPAGESLTAEKRGDILMARKMYREAVETYQKDASTSPVLTNKIGIAYHQLLNLEAARKHYERAAKMNPNYAEAINNLGTIYYGQKRYRKATSTYQRALKISPDSASIYSNLGTAYFARRQYDKALASYNRALELDPEVFDHRSAYGTLLQERKVEEKAKFHFFMALTYGKQGKTDRALQYLRMALEEGFKERDKVLEAPELAALRETPEFQELMANAPRVL